MKRRHILYEAFILPLLPHTNCLDVVVLPNLANLANSEKSSHQFEQMTGNKNNEYKILL